MYFYILTDIADMKKSFILLFLLIGIKLYAQSDLDLSNHKLDSLAAFNWKSVNITKLDLSNNQLKSLPAIVSDLPAMHENFS